MSFLPLPIVTDIIRRVGNEGFRKLGPFIAAGPDFKEMVYSDEVLAEVGLDEYIFVPVLAEESSPYRPFIDRCLTVGNKTAQYVLGLRILATVDPSQGIYLLCSACPHLLYARFAVAAFLCLCGNKEVGVQVFESFLERVPDIEEASYNGCRVCDQIQEIGPPGRQLIKGGLRWGTAEDIPYSQMDYSTLHIVCRQCFALSFCWHISNLC